MDGHDEKLSVPVQETRPSYRCGPLRMDRQTDPQYEELFHGCFEITVSGDSDSDAMDTPDEQDLQDLQDQRSDDRTLEECCGCRYEDEEQSIGTPTEQVFSAAQIQNILEPFQERIESRLNQMNETLLMIVQKISKD